MKRKYQITLMISIIFLLINLGVLMAHNTKAAEIPMPKDYYFVFNGQKKTDGTEYEMRAKEVLLQVTPGTWDSTKATVKWVSSEPGVVELKNSSHGTNFIELVRKGPGYSTITATVTQGDHSFSINCLIKVDLSVDVQKTGLTVATTTEDRILVINQVGEKKQIYLKYVDYVPDGATGSVSGGAISSSSVIFESENEGVVEVNDKGELTAVGAGSSSIKIITNTMSSLDKALSIKLQVVVRPNFSLSFTDAAGNAKTGTSVDNPNKSTAVEGVPSNFVIESTATKGTNLKWEVFDTSTGKKINAGKTDKMTYEISEMSGNVIFSRVKAGTYEIYAFANSKYTKDTNAPYAYMKIVVPFDISEKNVVMMVGDTYNIIDNTNIPSAGIFNYAFVNNILNVAEVDQKTGIIKAKSRGNVQLILSYIPTFGLYDPNINVPNIKINITVIDGIALSMSSAIMHTKSTLMLDTLLTDPTQEVKWYSSDESIATVEKGIVTTKSKSGKVIITAEQEVLGIVKRAHCEITVQESVATVNVAPDKVTLGIGEFRTLQATITPKNLSGVVLRWQSSNESVVKITESTPLSVTIQGVAGGNAVISAINQDNVVVGYSHITVQQPVTGITLSETSVVVDMATKRFQLRASVYPENATDQRIKWTSTDPSKAKVSDNGLVTILKPGNVTIIATSVDNPAITAMCNITISIPVTSVALDEKALTMFVGESKRLDYVLLPTNASNNAVTWTSTNTSVATVDSTGKVTAKGVGTTVIILRTLDGGQAVYSTITVKKVATGLKLDKTKLTLESGQYHYFIPTLTPKDSTETQIHWESSDTKVAIIEQNGKVTGKDAGIAIITARTESGAVVYVTVTVKKPVEGLILNFEEKTIFVGEDFELKASVSPSTATNLDVTWKSSNTKIATVSKNGIVKGLTGGTVVITATTSEKGYMASAVVTVKELVSTITLNHDSYTLGVDKSVMLVATVTTETASNKNVHWVSSNEKIATVSQKGKVTGRKLGHVTITAIALDGSEVEASTEIEVVRPVTSIKLNLGFMSMLVGDSKKLKATVSPTNATYRDVKWSSSDDSIAMVDDTGRVVALKAGTVNITAEALDNSGKKAVAVVSVGNRVPATSITVIDKKLILVPGESKTVQVVLNPVNSTDKFTWSTDNAGVAKVNKTTGRITAVSTGTATITAMTDSGKTAIIEITVIALNITELNLEQYTTYQYPLRVEGATGRISWSIDKPEVATVNNGIVSTRGTGKATITAYVNGRKLTCRLTVTKIGG